jgi:hypothetical protein
MSITYRQQLANLRAGTKFGAEPKPEKEESAVKPGKTKKIGAKPKRIKPASKKTAKRNRTLAKAYGPFIEAHPICEIRSPVCTGQTTCVHHTDGRGPEEVHDQSTWKGSCNPCNLYVETHHKWAEERGFKNRRTHKKK